MNNNYLSIWRIPGGYKIRANMEINPNKYHSMKYYDYSKREAIRQYRQQFGLVGKHLQLIEIWRSKKFLMGFFKKPISTAAAVKMQKLEKGN